jgi:hypothetical protein
MIVCSCLVITDADIERALLEILSQPEAPLPTPGVVYRHLEKKMICCGCSPLAVSTIYQRSTSWQRRASCAPTPAPARRGAFSSVPAIRLRSV